MPTFRFWGPPGVNAAASLVAQPAVAGQGVPTPSDSGRCPPPVVSGAAPVVAHPAEPGQGVGSRLDRVSELSSFVEVRAASHGGGSGVLGPLRAYTLVPSLTNLRALKAHAAHVIGRGC